MNSKTRKRTASEHSLNGIGNTSPRKKLKKDERTRYNSEEQMVVEPDLLMDEEEEEDDVPNNHLTDLSEWEIADLRILVESVEKEVPPGNTFKYRTTMDKIDWEAVAAGTGVTHTAEECKKAMNALILQVRTHRTLSEILVDAKVVAINPFRNKRTGRIIHPDMPKKPMTPYFRFFQEKRPKYKAVNPDMTPNELSRFMASEYNNLSEKKKAKYRRKYDEEMEEYRRKYAHFRLDHPELFKRKRAPPNRLAAQMAAAGMPEKPQKPYTLYLANRLLQPKYAGMDQKEAGEAIRAAWTDLSEEKRMKWIKKSIKDERRYEEELATFMAEHPNYHPPERAKASVLNKGEQKLKDKVEGRPERPPHSGYILYSQLMMPKLEELPAKEKVVIIAKRWKELEEEERARYNAKAAKAQAKYIEAFDAYLQTLPEEEREKVLAEQKLKLPSERRIANNARKASRAQVVNSALTYYQTEELMRMQREQPMRMKGELIVDINRRWAAMSNSERQEYINLAESIKDFLPAKGGGTGGVGAAPKKTRKKAEKNPKEIEFMAATGRKRPPKNGFTMYMRERGHDEQWAALPPTQKMKQMAAVWKLQFSEEERQVYNDKCKQMHDEYTEMVKRFQETGQLPTSEPRQTSTSITPAVSNNLSLRKQSSQQSKKAEERAKSPLKNTPNSTAGNAKSSSTATASGSTSPKKAASPIKKAFEEMPSNTYIYKMSSDDDSDSSG